MLFRSADFTRLGEQVHEIEELSEVLKVSYRHLEIYLKYLKEFQKKYQAYKKSLSYLDFNDLEQYTLQLLSENQGVAQTLYQQFHEIMIDEYQDTNEIQENLILLISRFQEPEINRFMVGDMKQSIYRFRKADLDIFNENISLMVLKIIIKESI